ncbi:6-phosphogluconolactonase [Nocardioides pacificus]
MAELSPADPAEPQVVVLPDPAMLAGEVASALLARLEAAQDEGRVPHVVLTGGSIADEIHREIARRATDSHVDWSRVELWWGDERFVAPGTADRNEAQAAEALLDQLPLDPARVHRMPSTADVPDVDAGAASYAEELASLDGPFDVVMLGLGPDGHIASLFPGHPGLEATGAAVGVRESPKPPPLRVSMTFETLNRARAVWFVVDGEGKADATAQALAGGDHREIPARGVQGQEETTWFLTESAASRL